MASRTYPCPDCDTPVQSRWLACPNCGAELTRNARNEPVGQEESDTPEPIEPQSHAIASSMPDQPHASPAQRKNDSILKAMGKLFIVALMAFGIYEAVKVPATKPNTNYKVGDTFRLRDWEYQVTYVDRQKALPVNSIGGMQEAKGVWQIVHMKIRNLRRNRESIHYEHFELRNPEGITVLVSPESTVYSAAKKLEVLPHSISSAGSIEFGLIFDVAPDIKGFRLYVDWTDTNVDLGQ